jgi:hypothetical protein
LEKASRASGSSPILSSEGVFQLEKAKRNGYKPPEEVKMKKQSLTVSYDVSNRDLVKAYQEILANPEHLKNVQLVEKAMKDFAEFARTSNVHQGAKSQGKK